MSFDDLTAFFLRLQDDDALQRRVRALTGSADERAEGVCALAAAEGYAFTPDELAAEQAKPAVEALDDETLQKVAGGLCGLPGGVASRPEPLG